MLLKITTIADLNIRTYISHGVWEDEVTDLFKLNYRFAVEQIDQRVGTFKAWQVKTQADGGRKKIPINFIDCTEFVDDIRWTHFLGLP